MEPEEEVIGLRLNASSAPSYVEAKPHRPKPHSMHRPQTYMEFLIVKLKDGPVRPSFLTRLLPLRHLVLFWVVKLLLYLLIYGVGYFFWRVVLPHNYFIESPSTVFILLGGWLVMTSLFAVGVFFTWVQVMVSVFCCGKGLTIWP